MRLTESHPALTEKRTIHTKKVFDPNKMNGLLKPASSNGKIGKGKDIVTKGPWRGLPIYTLTLEERKTCPTSCFRWSSCYGNTLFYGHRVDHTSKDFLPMLEQELRVLNIKHKQGFIVRLHILGDFYSIKYVNFWVKMLKACKGLRIFGYTAREPNTAIGAQIQSVNDLFFERFIVRFSTNNDHEDANLAVDESYEGESVTCPEQTDKTESCLTCGLCFNPNFTKNIKFLSH
jgi:hypothetical protein